MSKIVKVALLSLVFTLLSACGGVSVSDGGGNSTAYPFRNAFIGSLVTTSVNNVALSGYIGGSWVTGSARVVNNALVNGTFLLGMPSQLQTKTTTGSFTINGVPFPMNETEFSYYDYNYNYLGQIGPDFLIVSGPTFLPSTVQFGDSGVLYEGSTYADAQFSRQIGTQSAVFSVDPDRYSDRALLTIEITNYDLFGNIVEILTNSYYLTLDGRLLPISSLGESGPDFLDINYQ